MQVLGWQCRVLGKHTLDYEGVNLNNNDITDDPSSSPVTHLEETMVAPPVPGPAAAAPLEQTVLAGFRDCSEEAIRYLVDVEQLSEEDPLVVGLKQHLWDKQQQLDVQRLLEACSGTTWSHAETASGDENCRSSWPYHEQHYHRTAEGVVGPHQYTHTTPEHTHLHWPQASPSHPHYPADCSMEEEEEEEGSECHSPPHTDMFNPHGTTTMITPGSHPLLPSTNSTQEGDTSHPPQSPVSVLDLAMLAQHNPAIASLTEEILSLLGGEASGHDSDLESDFDFDQDDQGHSSD